MLELFNWAKQNVRPFTFNFVRGTDGSYIFIGEFSQVRVVNPTTGRIYGGSANPDLNMFTYGPGGIMTPNYNGPNALILLE